MKISVFTPTHKLANTEGYLERLYESLKLQTYPNWEWVVVPNNGGSCPDFKDDRVKIHPPQKSRPASAG